MLSIPHLVVIFLVALVVLGPEKLPQVARVLGKAMGDFRRITNEFRVQIEDEMRDLERQANIRKAATVSPIPAANPELMPAPADQTIHQSREITESRELTVNPSYETSELTAETPELTAEIDSAIAAANQSPYVAASNGATADVPAAETPSSKAPATPVHENVHEKPADGESQPA